MSSPAAAAEGSVAPGVWRIGRSLTVPATVEQVVAAVSVFWAFGANRAFLGAAIDGDGRGGVQAMGLACALWVMLVALHYLLVAPFAHRRTVKPLLAVLLVAAALATHFTQTFGVVLDAAMLRNVFRTDVGEARELLSWPLLGHLLLQAGLPILLLWRVRLVRRRWLPATGIRLASLLLAALAFILALGLVFKPFASLMRNHREIRYMAAPANVMWASAAAAAKELRGAARPRQPIGLDAAPGPLWAARTRPLLVVLVVGETARAANWGLNGYARDTTPQLARLPVLNFPDVRSCGTDTETSLPCMFAPVGRRDYDEARIRGSESLLHVAARAGVAVHWRDNQSGCKGVCDGLPNDDVKSLATAPGLCQDGRCFDEGLLDGLAERLQAARAAAGPPATQLLVLHQLGNHGPAYHRRYPAAFSHFGPACRHDDLQQCSRQEIVNAFDNALRYTDHVLARSIATLQEASDGVDSVLIYVSDHGESLGENNLYLHGLPYFMAPREQTQVPMVMWLSAGLARASALDTACLSRRAAAPAAHDHLFHTVLGLLDVKTALYEPQWDLAAECRNAAPP